MTAALALSAVALACALVPFLLYEFGVALGLWGIAPPLDPAVARRRRAATHLDNAPVVDPEPVRTISGPRLIDAEQRPDWLGPSRTDIWT
jgi:hypothetical protein